MKTKYDDFINKFRESDDNVKLSFLASLLHADQELQEKFINFTDLEKEDHVELSVDEFEKTICIYQREIEKRLQEIDLENPDFDNYVSAYSGYMKDWEIWEEASQQELQVIIDHYGILSIDFLKNQSLERMFAVLFGLYLACKETGFSDPIPVFDDVNNYLLETFTVTLRTVTDRINFAITPEAEVRKAVLLVIEYCLLHRIANKHFLSTLQPAVHAVAKKMEKGEEVLNNLTEPDRLGELFPRVYAQLLWSSGQRDKWHTVVRKYYQDDPEIADQLLLYYHRSKEWIKFGNLGQELFNLNEYYWAKRLKPLLNLDRERSLYLDVHLKLIKVDRDIILFKQIRSELSQNQVNKLIDDIFDHKFLVEILEEEKRYEDIKQLVNKNHDAYDFTEIMTPIIDIYPEYCFNTIKKIIKKHLKTERGRSVYRRVVDKLKLAQQIKGFEDKVDQLIQDVYQQNNRLPALRDEMRQAGLVSK